MRQSVFVRLVSIASVVSLCFVALLSLPAKAAGGLATDKVVSTHQSTPSATVVSPAFTTSQSAELLLAFVTTDGPAASGSQQFSSVTGGGLTWRLRQRTNIQYGTAEVWQAVASGILTNATVTATHTGSYQASITVATFTGADTATDGAVLGANGATGAPTATLTTTRTGSWVWGVGNDWSRATARTVGTGQTKVDEFLASSGDTFWTQRQTLPGTATAPSSVTINDTAPTTDMWNMSLIEILPSGAPDTTPPTAPTGLTATATSPTNVNLSWTASTDNVGVTGYRVFRAASQIGTSVTTSFSDNTTIGSTTYVYTVKAVDAAGNLSEASAPASVTTPAPDTTPPTVSLTSPANGSTVTGTTAVTANASDNQGVVGVQFKLDGANLSAESTSSPYSVQWDTTTVAGGSPVSIHI
jgi:chitodextrinase